MATRLLMVLYAVERGSVGLVASMKLSEPSAASQAKRLKPISQLPVKFALQAITNRGAPATTKKAIGLQTQGNSNFMGAYP
jgi:hypothetical protein